MINNEVELEKALMTGLQKALDDTIEYYRLKLIEIIDKVVYNEEPDWYTRTMQFRDSWEAQKAEIAGRVVESAIFQDLFTMKWVPEMFQHGNIVESLYPNEHALSNILNDGTDNAAYGFSPVAATHFWDEFINELNKSFDMIFLSNCKKYGVNAIGKVM